MNYQIQNVVQVVTVTQENKKAMKTLLFIIGFMLSIEAYSIVPIVEVKINNTVRTKDDYIGSTYVPISFSLRNGEQYGKDLPVYIQNSKHSTGKVLFSKDRTSAGFTNTEFTLSQTGTSFIVYIKASVLSELDKDAMIDIYSNEPNNRPYFIGRKAFMVTEANPLPDSEIRCEIIINTTSTLDDYVTWSPTKCRIRLSSVSSTSVPVTIQNSSIAVGKVVFENSLLARGNTATKETLNITLPASGSWVNFYISGKFGEPSIKDKDAIIEVLASGISIGNEALMVRIRKNANTISESERDIFLDALYVLNNTYNEYLSYVEIHKLAEFEAHKGPGFLAWHRIFLLDLEKKLQTIDPAVSLPYWKYDEPALNLFSLDFMGMRPLPGFRSVRMSSSNPLSQWNIESMAGIFRNTKFFENSIPANIKSEIATLGAGTTYSAFRILETNPHGTAHRESGSSGDWITSLALAVRDPLFFLLHCNVDRQWAKWQWLNDRFVESQSNSYSLQGSFVSGIWHIGHYSKDTVWPYNEITGTGGTAVDQRPTEAKWGQFPQDIELAQSLKPKPTPSDVVNYLDNISLVQVNQGLNFCYDDTPFE